MLIATKPFGAVYKRYRYIALAVYAAVLVASMIDFAYGGIGPGSLVGGPENLRFAMFVSSLLGLIGTEIIGVGHSSFERSKPKLSSWVPFILRLLLFTAIFLITDLKYTRILFLIFILYSYLGVSRKLSYGLAALGIVALLGLGIYNPVLMGLVAAPPQVSQSEQPPPRPSRPPLNVGGLIDASMGSVIALFFTLLLARTMAQTLQDQQKLEALHSSLATSHAQLQRSSSRVAELAATEERNRLARDIHDSLGHHLAAINIQLEKASAYRNRDPERAAEAITQAQRSVKDALADVRESVSSLREEETFSLEEALDALVKRMSHSNLAIKVSMAGNSKPYGRLALMTLYRVIQEALTNVHKHASASLVMIHIDFSQHQARLDIMDNGEGFDVSAWENGGAMSYGLRGLQERLSLVGGSLGIQSQPRQTLLNVTLPHRAHG